MESYGEWRVTVYDVTFGELKFFDSHATQLSELYRKPNFGELAVNSNSPIFSVVRLWRVSRNFMYTECFYKFKTCFIILFFQRLLFLC